MDIDDSFKKEGTVPFKWEIRPGVPKIQQHQQSSDHSRPIPSTPQKIKPPPSGLYFQAPLERQTNSFRSLPRTQSEHQHLGRSVSVRPQYDPSGCFPTPILRRKDQNKTRVHMPELKPKPEFEFGPEYTLDPETLSWSESTRMFFSHTHDCDSWSSTSFSSTHSLSPRPVYDVEWAGFGLF